PTPARELDAHARRPRQPECVERRERHGCVRDLMTGGEVEADAVELGSSAGDFRVYLGDANDLEVVARDRKVRWNDRRPAAREKLDQLALRAGYSVERLDELEVNRSDVRDHPDLGAGDRAQRRDLSEPAHRELENAHFSVGLEPAQRQRNADLVVEA